MVLRMAMTHMSLGTLQGAAALTAFVAGVSLVSGQLAGDWTRVSTQLDTSLTYITTTDWHWDSVPHSVLGLSE